MKKIYPLLMTILALCLAIVESRGQVNLPLINTPYSQNFDSLASSGTTNEVTTLPQGWTFLETGTNANTTYAAGTGSGNGGNTYSFGLTGDRALGGLLSGSLTPTLGVSFVNNTGSTITSIDILYHGEQWRLGATARADRLDFQYSLDAASLSSGTWIDVNELDFVSPVTAGVVGALNGNDSINSSTLSFNITGLNLEPGSTFFFRWLDVNASGADDGLAIDNFVIIPHGLPSDQPSIVLSPSTLGFGDVNLNESDTLSYEVTGSNLEDSIVVSTANAAYLVSTDAINFFNIVTLPDSGGVVFVKFAPVMVGFAQDSVYHQSGSTAGYVLLNGNGFDQVASIIPIAEARLKPVGTKVTVAGRITVADELGNPAYVQDGTGGIPVFDFALASSVAIGDSVIVTGPVGIFNDQIQISGAGIFFTKADSSSYILSPKPITISELAAHEGLLVTVGSVELVNKNFVFYPQSTEQITSGGIQADLRIDGNTDIPGLTKPPSTFHVTGVVGRFRQNAQLMPRFRQDIPGAVEPSNPADSIPHSATFDVVNWNLEFFGARRENYPEEYGPVNEELQLENVKKVITALDADIIAVQEVSNDTLFAALVAQLGRYQFTCSDRYSYSFQGPGDEFPPQKVCFIYDTTTIDVIRARVLFENLYDSARTIDPGLLPGYPTGDASSFYSSGRLPYLLTINATINGVTEKISFIDVHAKSGAAAADRSRRLYDATVLKDSLDAHFPGERFIFLGDLNDDLDQSITTGQPSPYEAFATDTARYAPISKALSDAGARSTVGFSDVIDHQIISNELVENYIGGSVQIFTPFTLIPDYANTTSDHLAVISRYLFKTDEINFVTESIENLPEANVSKVVKVVVNQVSAEPRQVVIRTTGNATYGSDYITVPPVVNNSLILSLPAHSDTVTFEVKVLDDAADELEEFGIFELQSSDGLAAGSQNQFIVIIKDNDVPAISFQQLLYVEKEGSGDHQIKLKLTTPPATAQTITLVALNGPGVSYGTDYLSSPAVAQNKIIVTIPAGNSQPSFTFTPKTDTKRELPETVSFYIESVSSGLLAKGPRLTVFTILDANRRQLQFVVSPNPTVGTVKVSAEGIEPHEKVYSELRNPDGLLIYKGEGTLKQLDEAATARLQTGRRGVYILKILFEDEVYLIRILKN